MMPLKIPHLGRCFVFLVIATYAPVRFIPWEFAWRLLRRLGHTYNGRPGWDSCVRALPLAHFERHQLSKVLAGPLYIKIVLAVLVLLASAHLFLAGPLLAFELKTVGREPVDPAAAKVLEKAAARLQLTNVEVFDARKSELLKGFWNLSFSSAESGRMILFTDGEVAVPVVQKLQGNTAGNAVFREWQGMFVGDVRPDASWAYLLKEGTAPDHSVVIVDNLWTETAADFMDWFEGKRSTGPYGEIETSREASVYFVPSFGVFSRTDADLAKHCYVLLDGKFLPEKYVVTALSRIDQAYKRDPELLMRQMLVLVGPKRKEEYVRMFNGEDLKKIRKRTRESYRKVGLNLPKFLIADGRFFMRLEDLWGGEEIETMKSKKGTLTTGAVTLILAFASGALAQAADLRSEVEARYGRELLSTFEQMQSGIREPDIQSSPEASEPGAQRFKNDISASFDDAGQSRLQDGLDAALKGLHDWASGPTGASIKEDLPLRLPAEEEQAADAIFLNALNHRT